MATNAASPPDKMTLVVKKHSCMRNPNLLVAKLCRLTQVMRATVCDVAVLITII